MNSTNEEEQEISQTLKEIFEKVDASRIKMDKIIQYIKNYLRVAENNKIDESDFRIHKNLFNSMLIKYRHVIERFHDEESKINKIKENKIIRSAEIALDQELNEKQRHEIIQNPQKVQQIYANKLKGKAHVKLQNAVRDLEERHKDILKLEKSIIELHNLIIQMRQLVSYQGEMIDNIAENLNNAKDYIIKGETQINKAHERMKKPFYKF
jgi:t-SNARE complex subunit (syntaxin)